MLETFKMLLVAIIMAITVAAVSTAIAADNATVPNDNGAETTAVHTDNTSAPEPTRPRRHQRYYHHHRFHPVHEASEIIHHATGTKPVRPKPVVN